MTSTVPRKHAATGLPGSVNQCEVQEARLTEDDRQFASRDRALEFATALANRNAELMRRLA